MRTRPVSAVVLCLALGAAATARADDATHIEPAPIALCTALAYAASDDPPPAPAAPPADPAQTAARPRFGSPDGHWWITLGAGLAHDTHEDTDYNAHAAFSTFIATELEFAVELGGWYFAQSGEDTGGINPNLIFRWHFCHDPAFDWSLYADVGIGLLFAFDDVPDGGTSFDFTPRAGLGFTHRIGDCDTRLQLGLRYHHISNARIQGDDRNPGRDSIMIYAGVIFPF
ncbi:MAG: acyloxyacyl hydrolase [Phycisphaerae bacterium]|nr:acyloxyacyl hydrolase [Phycisphaerae bacterium]